MRPSWVDWSRWFNLMWLGAAGFWLPDVFVHAVRGFNFNNRDVYIVTTVAPLSLLITFLLASRAGKTLPRKRVGLPLLTGVWLLGGMFMLVSASFSGGGFLGDGRSVMETILLSFVPVYAAIMATYDGALIALLLVTVVAFFLWIVQRGYPFFRLWRSDYHAAIRD